MNTGELIPIDIELCRALFSYDPVEGILRWKVSRGNMKAGEPAGTPNNNGYLQVSLGYRKTLVHRIIWALMTGEQPPRTIDHKSTNRLDNRWDNLRRADASLQQANRKVQHNSRTGIRGVCLVGKRFVACITVRGKRTYLGSFKHPNDAKAAYDKAANEAWGEFRYNPGATA